MATEKVSWDEAAQRVWVIDDAYDVCSMFDRNFTKMDYPMNPALARPRRSSYSSLQDKGYAFRAFQNAGTFLDALQKDIKARGQEVVVNDIILTDRNMPEMVGETLLDQVRKLLPEIRAIAMSGVETGVTSGIAAVMPIFGNRATYFLPKPLSRSKVEQLMGEIERLEAKGIKTHSASLPHSVGVQESLGYPLTPELIASRSGQSVAPATPRMAEDAGGEAVDEASPAERVSAELPSANAPLPDRDRLFEPASRPSPAFTIVRNENPGDRSTSRKWSSCLASCLPCLNR